jgi:hypothetical protein
MEEEGTDEDIDNSMTDHRPQTVVGVEPVDVRGHQELTSTRVDATLLRMEPTRKSHTWPKSILGNITRNRVLSTRLCEELCLILGSFEG